MKTALYTMMRVNSNRIPRKMLQSVGLKTLAEICLEKLSEASKRSGLNCFCFAHETEIVELCEKHGVGVIPRTEESANSDKLETAMRPIVDFFQETGHSFAIWLNASAPFLSVDTVLKAVEFAKGIGDSIFWSAQRLPRPLLWDSGRNAVVRDLFNNTRIEEQYWIRSHVIGGWPVTWITDSRVNCPAVPFQIESLIEHIDIDEPKHLELARLIWAGQFMLRPWEYNE